MIFFSFIFALCIQTESLVTAHYEELDNPKLATSVRQHLLWFFLINYVRYMKELDARKRRTEQAAARLADAGGGRGG